jgi:hypothetical protein
LRFEQSELFQLSGIRQGFVGGREESLTTVHWLKPPPATAPDPFDRKKSVLLGISSHFVERSTGVFRRTSIYQIWTHTLAKLPPINNISRLGASPNKPTLTTLADSVACFSGVNRPYDDEPNGESVVVYVLNPAVSIEYEVDMACLARGVTVPADTALTVQVKPTNSLQIDGQDIFGLVTRLEFVSGDGGRPVLPKGHSTRYLKRLWLET